SRELTHSRQGERSSPESQMPKNFISRKLTGSIEHCKNPRVIPQQPSGLARLIKNTDNSTTRTRINGSIPPLASFLAGPHTETNQRF
ncbi:hypothetical protein N8600_03715, partial [Gammaproteobacteria bacterium]|nr:hypothetical protein [Gammaproteobacteria bacterium]